MMKLGMNTAILGELPFDQVVDFAASLGLQSIEAACWPVGKAERRYAGVTHIDVESLTRAKADDILCMLHSRGLSLESLAYSPNPLVANEELRQFYFAHIRKVLRAASLLHVRAVDTFIGKDHRLSVGENMELFRRYWPDTVKYAEDVGVAVTFENCPMYFTKDEWPGGKNLAASPSIWREMFSVIDSDFFGITYDPSHFAWQRMNYIKPIYEFAKKIFNVHLKDAKFDQDRYDDVGYFACPLEYHAPKLPGLGDIQWGKVVSALTDVGFSGSCFIEVEDRAFEGSEADKRLSLALSRNYMRQLIPGGERDE